MFLELMLAAGMQAASCRPIQTDHITGGDLASVIPTLNALPQEQSYSLAPIPGQRRVFRANELTRLAKSVGITDAIESEVCFEWARKVPDREVLLTAMRRSLQDISATVELVDEVSTPIPEGNVDFPLNGLSGASSGPVVWRGTVAYSPNRTVPLWTRVRVTVHEKHVLAAGSLKPGQAIGAADLRTEEYSGPFQREKKYSELQQVIGLMPKNTVAAGTVLTEALLRPVNDVERGDVVQVVVQMRSARIEAEGIAEEGGVRGSVVTIRNTKSGRRFRARIESRDKVLVLPTALAGLAVEESKS